MAYDDLDKRLARDVDDTQLPAQPAVDPANPLNHAEPLPDATAPVNAETETPIHTATEQDEHKPTDDPTSEPAADANEDMAQSSLTLTTDNLSSNKGFTNTYDPNPGLDLTELSGEHEDINCHIYSRKTGKRIEALDLDEVSRSLTNKNQFIWLGLYDPTVDTIKKVQHAFDLHELALEDAFADHQRAKIESYGNETLFVVVRTAKLKQNLIHYGTTAMFMGNNYIITIRSGASDSYASVRQQCHQRPEKMRMGPIFVMHAILDFIVDNYLPITERLGEYLREQERNIFSYEFSKDTLKSLYELKSQLVHMRAVVLPVQDICNFFINHKKNDLISTFPNAAKPYFRDINDHLLRALDAVNGLNEMLSVAMDTYMAMVNMGQNEVVRKLAAWAGILAVPTAVAGIYGMNFAYMPELRWHYAYFVVLGLIAVVCVFLYQQFKKSGWL